MAWVTQGKKNQDYEKIITAKNSFFQSFVMFFQEIISVIRKKILGPPDYQKNSIKASV